MFQRPVPRPLMIAALTILGLLCLPGVVALLVGSGFFVNILLLRGSLSLLRPYHYVLALVVGAGLWTGAFALAHQLTRSLIFGITDRPARS